MTTATALSAPMEIVHESTELAKMEERVAAIHRGVNVVAQVRADLNLNLDGDADRAARVLMNEMQRLAEDIKQERQERWIALHEKVRELG